MDISLGHSAPLAAQVAPEAEISIPPGNEPSGYGSRRVRRLAPTKTGSLPGSRREGRGGILVRCRAGSQDERPG